MKEKSKIRRGFDVLFRVCDIDVDRCLKFK